MTQQSGMFFSSVHCHREKDDSIAKLSFYEIGETKEKHIANIEVCSSLEGMRRGFKFLGDGRYANLPQTRLRVDLDALFEGKLSGFATRNVENSIRPGRFSISDGKKDVMIYSIPTFGNVETSSFGSFALVKSRQPDAKRLNAKKSAPLGGETRTSAAGNAVAKEPEKGNKTRKRAGRSGKGKENVMPTSSANIGVVEDAPPLSRSASAATISGGDKMDCSAPASVSSLIEYSDSDSENDAYSLIERFRHLKKPIWTKVGSDLLKKLDVVAGAESCSELRKRHGFKGKCDYSIKHGEEDKVFEGFALNSESCVYEFESEGARMTVVPIAPAD